MEILWIYDTVYAIPTCIMKPHLQLKVCMPFLPVSAGWKAWESLPVQTSVPAGQKASTAEARAAAAAVWASFGSSGH